MNQNLTVLFVWRSTETIIRKAILCTADDVSTLQHFPHARVLLTS